MLTNLTLENFKAFQKLDDLKIKPITILCGANSSGKSSILQSILLLKQTLENLNPTQNLLLNGRFVDLGYFNDIAYGKLPGVNIAFNTTFQLYNSKDIFSAFLGVKSISDESSKKIKNAKSCYIDFYVELKLPENQIFDDLTYLKSLEVNELTINVFDEFFDRHLDVVISIRKISNSKYLLEWKESKKIIYSQEVGSVGFSNLFPSMILHDPEKSTPKPYNDYPRDVMISLLGVKDVLRAIFQAYSYIGPLREEPARRYIFGEGVSEIGSKGENAAYHYLIQRSKLIGRHYFFNASTNDFFEESGHTLHSSLKKWFELMKISNFEVEIDNKIVSLNLDASSFDETRVNIADVGFGISQMFPIVLEGLRMEKGSTLMLEQPEIHLHPNLQMQMADFFISLALSGKQVLVETHSDHVINRLVRRIVEDETHNLQDLIGIYFIKPSENGSVYEEVKIDETKGIVNWPPDFFDQTANEQMKIMQAGLKKRKNQRAVANGKNS